MAALAEIRTGNLSNIKRKFYSFIALSLRKNGKGKGKFHPRTAHEVPDGE